MKRLGLLLLLPLVLRADQLLKIDPARSYVDVDVKATVGSFTGHLDRYTAAMTLDDKGKIKTATLDFKFADLRTGKPDRDQDMIQWLGGGEPAGRFELGILALTPSGQGQVTGSLTFHDTTQLVEFPVNISRSGDTLTITGEARFDYTNWKLKVIRKMGLVKVNPEIGVRFKFTGEPAGPVPPPAK
jgi:polyisoprenoid-binding protein YceI